MPFVVTEAVVAALVGTPPVVLVSCVAGAGATYGTTSPVAVFT
jgi:hypothetical protein